MTEVFSDDFNRANSSTLGGNWVEDQNDMEINGNKLLAVTIGAEVLFRNTSAIGSADYEVEAVCDGQGGYALGPIGRINPASPTQNYYLTELETAASGTVQQYKRVAGTYTSLGSYVYGTGTGIHTVKLSMQGTTIKTYLDGVERISAVDSAHSAEGDFGGRIVETDSPSTDSFDNFKVYDFASGGTISPSSITSGSAVGSHVVSGAATISPSSIGSTAAIGSHTLSGAATISPSSIGSTTTIGSHVVASEGTISPTAVELANVIGTHVVSSAGVISPSGISSTSSIGSHTLTPGGVTISPSGISSTVTIGNPIIAITGVVPDLCEPFTVVTSKPVITATIINPKVTVTTVCE